MQSEANELECQVCGNTQMSGQSQVECPACGGMMIRAPFFSVSQSHRLVKPDSDYRNMWIALIVLLLIGLAAAVVILVVKNVQGGKPTFVKPTTPIKR